MHLELSGKRQRISADSLCLHAFLEEQVRNQDADPVEKAKDRGQGYQISEDNGTSGADIQQSQEEEKRRQSDRVDWDRAFGDSEHRGDVAILGKSI